MCLIAAVGMLAGCSKAKTHDNPFAIYNDYENMQVDIGDKRDDVAKLFGIEERYVTLFEEDNIEQVEYWGMEDVDVDFDLATGRAIGMRFENPQWSLFNGLKIGDGADAVKKRYPEDMIHTSERGNLYVAYDNDGNVIEYSEDAPYIVLFDIEDGKIAIIYVEHNAVYPKYE